MVHAAPSAPAEVKLPSHCWKQARMANKFHEGYPADWYPHKEDSHLKMSKPEPQEGRINHVHPKRVG